VIAARLANCQRWGINLNPIAIAGGFWDRQAILLQSLKVERQCLLNLLLNFFQGCSSCVTAGDIWGISGIVSSSFFDYEGP